MSPSEVREYRRAAGSDTWHFCANCAKYPQTGSVSAQREKPESGELCNECRAKEKAGKCKGVVYE